MMFQICSNFPFENKVLKSPSSQTFTVPSWLIHRKSALPFPVIDFSLTSTVQWVRERIMIQTIEICKSNRKTKQASSIMLLAVDTPKNSPHVCRKCNRLSRVVIPQLLNRVGFLYQKKENLIFRRLDWAYLAIDSPSSKSVKRLTISQANVLSNMTRHQGFCSNKNIPILSPSREHVIVCMDGQKFPVLTIHTYNRRGIH